MSICYINGILGLEFMAFVKLILSHISYRMNIVWSEKWIKFEF